MKCLKQKTYAQLKKQLDTIFSEFIRRKEANSDGVVSCVSCGTRRYWKDDMQCGHYITRDKLAIRWDERNCHTQCRICNYKQKLTGDCTEYTIWMVDNLGYSVIQDLREIKDIKVKLYREDLLQKIDHYKIELKKL